MYKCLIIMGSKSDKPKVMPAIEYLQQYSGEISVEIHILSAHRTTLELMDTVRSSHADVIITCAGMSNALSGLVASCTIRPVIGVPLSGSNEVNNLAALLATLQMPPGIPVATMAVDGTKNAAIFAMQILAVTDNDIQQILTQSRYDQKNQVLKDDEQLQKLTT